MPAQRTIGPSRYATVVATAITHTDGSTRLAFELRDPISKNDLGDRFFTYTTIDGDQLDWLAYRFGGDTRLWWVLADLNQDISGLDDPIRIPAGTQLVVPTEDFFTSFQTP